MVEIDDALAANYTALREERGLSWGQLADQFEKDDFPRSLQAWARGKAEDEDATAAPKRRGKAPVEPPAGDEPKQPRNRRARKKGAETAPVPEATETTPNDGEADETTGTETPAVEPTGA